VVAISGPDCAGKSTIAVDVVRRLESKSVEAAAISIDDYLVPRAQRDGLPDEGTDCYERAFDYARLRKTVAGVKHVSTGSRSRNAPSPPSPPDAPLIVVEGVFLLRRDLIDLWDLTVWLDADEETIVSRAAVRDAAYFGGPSEARRVYLTRLLPAQAFHRQTDSPEARASLSFRWDGVGWRSVREPQLGYAQQQETDGDWQGEHAKRKDRER
jgi:uridine kinase